MNVRELFARMAGLFGRGRRDDELAQELAFHREMLEARHRERGLDPDAARRAAAVDLGGTALVAEQWRDQRGLPAVEMLWQDARYAARMLRRTPGFTAAALITLAIGIGANTAIFTVVDGVLLRPLPYPHPEQLVSIGDRAPDGFAQNIGFTTVVDWRERSRSFQGFTMMRSWLPTLVTNGEAERLPAVRVSANYFDTIGVHPAIGRAFTDQEDRPDRWHVVILSDRLWRRRFNADPSIVGRAIVMSDSEFRVVGIMPANFEPLDAQRYYKVNAELWAPIGYDVNDASGCRSCQHLRAFGRLKPGVTVAAATAEMNAIREQMRREHPTNYDAGSIAIVPLQRALTGRVQSALYVLLGAVGFVLLIACANVANLLLARAVARQRELALRAVLGASRRRIVRQLLTESGMLSAIGAAAGVGLATFAVRAITAVAPISLPRADRIEVDGRVLLFTAAIAIFTSIAFGLMPAWRGSAAGTGGKLAIDSRGSVGGRARARSLLVVADLVLALVLLAGAGLMLRTVFALTRTDPGFHPERMLSLQFSLVGKPYAEDTAVAAFQTRAIERLRALPGVEGVTIAGQIPFGGYFDCRGFHAFGRVKPNPADDPCIERYGVTSEYLQVMGIPLRAGRFFDARDTESSEPVIVISESAARTVWGADDPLGAKVRMGNYERGPWRTVIGVVADVHHDDLATAAAPAIYTPQSQFTDSYLTAVIKASGDAAALAVPARAVLREMDASVPVYEVATVGALIEKSAAPRLFVMRLLTGFAIVALLLAAIGLYGVVSYGVAQRTREVGVRIALGAQRADVLRLVLSGGFRLTAAGVVGGLAAALASTRFLGTLVYGVSPFDPVTFLAAAVLLCLVALLAHWIPVRRAMRIDPATALRAD